MADILNAIKQETAVWQKKVEAAIPVFNESFTLGAYITLLERFYGFYSALDSSFGDSDGLKALLPDWRERRKIPSLEDDLLWLGCDFQNLLHVPVCRQMPVLNSIESVLGALYVTERSTLGGQAISRQLASSLRVMPGAGATFFYGYGEATEAKWKGFTAVLTSIATRANERLVIQSAIEITSACGYGSRRWQ